MCIKFQQHRGNNKEVMCIKISIATSIILLCPKKRRFLDFKSYNSTFIQPRDKK